MNEIHTRLIASALYNIYIDMSENMIPDLQMCPAFDDLKSIRSRFTNGTVISIVLNRIITNLEGFNERNDQLQLREYINAQITILSHK